MSDRKPTPIRTTALRELALDIQACTKCALADTRIQPVPGDGDETASIVLIGEAPGKNEDSSGHAFCGRSGQRLDKWLVSAGFRPRKDPRVEMFVTNVLKCRPPNNRWTIAEDDFDAPSRCTPYLEKQIKLVQPRAVILAGRNATQWALLRGAAETADPYGPWVGRLYRRRDLYGETRFACIWHPSYVMRNENPWEEKKCIDALTQIREYVEAVQYGESPPLHDLHDVRPVGHVQHQQRMRLFLPPEKTDADDK